MSKLWVLHYGISCSLFCHLTLNSPWQVIVEQYVQSHPNGLQAMYNRLLEFVPHHCRLLREVTGGAISR